MAVIRFVVVDSDGSELKKKVGSEEGYEKVLAYFGVKCLIDSSDGYDVEDFAALEDGGRYTLGPPKKAPSGPPPATPPQAKKRCIVPPSDGMSKPKLAQPTDRPSSKEGKEEGLNHASNDNVTFMQCTSHPACVSLLGEFEDALKAQKELKLEKESRAAKHVLQARNRVESEEEDKIQSADFRIGKNERFFTGAMASAMNSLLEDGYVVQHQACIGTGATHSDLSATRIHVGDTEWTNTLMVGEGKWNAAKLRDETRGQIFNALLRHRAIDRPAEYGPILLLAFDNRKIEVDIAFPATKGGKLAQDGLVEFRGCFDDKRETFWTVRLLSIGIDGDLLDDNLPPLFRFLSKALAILHKWPQQSRVQFKMPMPLTVDDAADISNATTYGENVTFIERRSSGSRRVYKEYCYHLRKWIEPKDRRRPPPKELLEALGTPYKDWEIHKGPCGISVLCYDFISGTSNKPSVKGWLKVLDQIQRIHSFGFVHGDLLPRNIIFGDDDDGYVIDFDLSREEGQLYVKGFNHDDFKTFRHPNARERTPMKKEHDLHSLRQLSKMFFDLTTHDIDDMSIEKLLNFFQDNPNVAESPNLEEDLLEATDSPPRRVY